MWKTRFDVLSESQIRWKVDYRTRTQNDLALKEFWANQRISQNTFFRANLDKSHCDPVARSFFGFI